MHVSRRPTFPGDASAELSVISRRALAGATDKTRCLQIGSADNGDCRIARAPITDNSPDECMWAISSTNNSRCLQFEFWRHDAVSGQQGVRRAPSAQPQTTGVVCGLSRRKRAIYPVVCTSGCSGSASPVVCTSEVQTTPVFCGSFWGPLKMCRQNSKVLCEGPRLW